MPGLAEAQAPKSSNQNLHLPTSPEQHPHPSTQWHVWANLRFFLSIFLQIAQSQWHYNLSHCSQKHGIPHRLMSCNLLSFTKFCFNLFHQTLPFRSTANLSATRWDPVNNVILASPPLPQVQDRCIKTQSKQVDGNTLFTVYDVYTWKSWWTKFHHKVYIQYISVHYMPNLLFIHVY